YSHRKARKMAQNQQIPTWGHSAHHANVQSEVGQPFTASPRPKPDPELQMPETEKSSHSL
ncbi:hypothetical protein, partial [Salmonella enterica]|uniref:hypothetical protein n=1 Tax=Salmonella enterica TaxID=28901 RepID=UPI0035231267